MNFCLFLENWLQMFFWSQKKTFSNEEKVGKKDSRQKNSKQNFGNWKTDGSVITPERTTETKYQVPKKQIAES